LHTSPDNASQAKDDKEHPSSISRKAVTNREKDSNCYGRKINNQFSDGYTASVTDGHFDVKCGDLGWLVELELMDGING
jgi:hypothetical protein